MKAFFGMTDAVLLVVMMLFAALPETGLAAKGKVTLAEMVKIKKAADGAAQAEKRKIRNVVRHCTGGETTCTDGNRIKHYICFYTYEELEGIWPFREWVAKQTEPEDIYQNSGKCQCDPFIFGLSATGGTCGKCKHCDNFQCVPDSCKASPSSPDDCPCPPAK